MLMSVLPSPTPITLQVFPRGMLGLLFAGFKGEVWIQPGEQLSQGQLYREKVQGRVPKPMGAVSLVLGEYMRGRRGGRGKGDY